jgi:hypothetical protein
MGFSPKLSLDWAKAHKKELLFIPALKDGAITTAIINSFSLQSDPAKLSLHLLG